MSCACWRRGLDNEDHTKDIDFSPSGIRKRWEAGYANTQRAIEQAPWKGEFDPLEGVILHEPRAVDGKLERGSDRARHAAAQTANVEAGVRPLAHTFSNDQQRRGERSDPLDPMPRLARAG